MKLIMPMLLLGGLFFAATQASEKRPVTPLIVVVKAYPCDTLYANESYNTQHYGRDLQKLVYFQRLQAAVPPHLAQQSPSIDDEQAWHESISHRIAKLKQ